MGPRIDLSKFSAFERRIQKTFKFPDGMTRVLSFPQWVWNDLDYIRSFPTATGEDILIEQYRMCVDAFGKTTPRFEEFLHWCLRERIKDCAAYWRGDTPIAINDH